MTCDEWHAADKSIAGFEAMTGAERAAIYRHSQICPACRAIIEAAMEEVRRTTTADGMRRMAALCDKDMRDPEVREVIEGGGR